MSIAPLARDFSGTARLGLALAVASAIGYGTMITATRLSYDAGSNPLTLICARAAVPAAILALLMLARGSAFALRPGALWPVAGIALGQLGITIGYLSAVAYIPVSLAALVFYAYPVLVAGLLPLTGRGGVGWTTAARSEEHTSELQSLMRISYAVFCLKKKNNKQK